MRAEPLQFGGERPAEQHVGARQVAKCKSACSAILVRNGSITTSLPPLRFAAADAAHEVQIGDGRVVAPDHVELGVAAASGPMPGDGAVSAGPGLAAHPAAQRAAIELLAPSLWKKRNDMLSYANRPCGPA